MVNTLSRRSQWKKFIYTWGWSGGAMMLGKLPVPGGLTILD